MTLLYLALLILSGFGAARALARFGLPEVTGYLLVGLAFGPSLLHVVGHDAIASLEPLATFCLATIFFMLGEEFDVRQLRQLGPRFLLTTVVQSLVACFVVVALLLMDHAPLPVALLLGAIAGTSDPAATLAVLRETRAKGELVKTLLAIVALNGFVEMAILSILVPIVGYLHPGNVSGLAIVVDSVRGLLAAVSLGLLLGFVVRAVTRHERIPLELPAIGAILLGAGASAALHLSVLLVMLTFGAFVANFVPRRAAVFQVARTMQGPTLAIFFTIAGAGLNLGDLAAVGGLGVLYVIGRLVGKLAGGSLGAWLGGAAPVCRRYLGCGLIPQAGMAIGLAVVLQQQFPDLMAPLMPIVLGAVVVFELVGPLATRVALWRSGALAPQPAAEEPKAPRLASPRLRPGHSLSAQVRFPDRPGPRTTPSWRVYPSQSTGN